MPKAIETRKDREAQAEAQKAKYKADAQAQIEMERNIRIKRQAATRIQALYRRRVAQRYYIPQKADAVYARRKWDLLGAFRKYCALQCQIESHKERVCRKLREEVGKAQVERMSKDKSDGFGNQEIDDDMHRAIKENRFQEAMARAEHTAASQGFSFADMSEVFKKEKKTFTYFSRALTEGYFINL